MLYLLKENLTPVLLLSLQTSSNTFNDFLKEAIRESTDNLNGAEPDREGFTRRVRAQLLTYVHSDFPPRATMFINALREKFNGPELNQAWLDKENPQ